MFNLPNFFKKTPAKPENFIALDFGTTSTKAFIFSLGERVDLLGQGQGTPEEAVEAASASAGFRPTQAVVGIGKENAWCSTTTVRFNRPDPEKEIEPQEIEKLHEQIFRTALIQATSQMSEFFGDPELTLQLIDSEILYHKIDGQVINDPLGQKGNVLEASIFTAHSPATYLEQLSETLKKLNLNLWAVSSLMFILVRTLANDNLLGFNSIILDVGGKVTDVAVVFGGGIWGTRPLLLGSEALTKDGVELWLSGVETALADFEGVKTFPSRIILTGGGANFSELKEDLLAYPLTRTLPFASPPLVEVRTDVGPQNMRLIAKDILGESDAT